MLKGKEGIETPVQVDIYLMSQQYVESEADHKFAVVAKTHKPALC